MKTLFDSAPAVYLMSVKSNPRKEQLNMNMQSDFAFKNQRGLSLIEAMVFFSIAAVVVVGALAMYGTVRTEQKTMQTISEYQSIRASLQSLYQGQSYGTGNLLGILNGNKRLPETITASVSGGVTTATNDFGGSVTVVGNTANFRISYDRVPKEVCTGMLVALTKTRDWVSYNVVNAGGSVGTSPTNITAPLTVAAADSACANNENLVSLWAR